MILSELKRKLRITWEDDDTNQELSDLIEESKEALMHKLGAFIDFENAHQERELLIARCMYSYNNILNDFDSAYGREIRELRIKYEVMNSEEE